jgi:DNA-binding LacI/PurR family transcriptional regulator
MGMNVVRSETREKVLKAMDELGYAPNTAARALRYGSFGTIGVIAHQLSRTGISRTVDAVAEAARRNGYTLTLVDVDKPSPGDVGEALARLTQQSIDGLVIAGAEKSTPTSIALPPRMPVVVSDSRFVGQHPAVGADQATGAKLAVAHLLGLGHRTVQHVAGPRGSNPARIRLASWKKTLREAGREVPQTYRGDWSADSGYRAGLAIAKDPAVTAVFAANDEMAMGLIHAIHDCGLRVPDDVSVVGFDNIELARHSVPPLTTIHQDFRVIGDELVNLLLRQIWAKRSFGAEHVTVPVSLVVRESAAPPRPRPIT